MDLSILAPGTEVPASPFAAVAESSLKATVILRDRGFIGLVSLAFRR